ncbi:VC2046/SO_2500 family protein [Ferrimonas futtsuensis]|uniref:VC2046/SO_2500 family protein n=1 Tax=Ferrimonas futtsuensis TaxID=364764 RepID=UPI00146DFEE6|nr:VC2046/SO_2500 family protein [Ferrimonas futtsuensis]
MQAEAILVNEWQLGDSLSQAIQTERRSDFGLMLAMLSQDVRLHAEFQLPKPAGEQEQDLRERFALPEPEQAKAQYKDAQRSCRIASAFHQSGLPQSRLQHCLDPDALVYEGSHSAAMQQALANCSPSVKREDAQVQAARQPGQWRLEQLLAAQRLQAGALV